MAYTNVKFIVKFSINPFDHTFIFFKVFLEVFSGINRVKLYKGNSNVSLHLFISHYFQSILNFDRLLCIIIFQWCPFLFKTKVFSHFFLHQNLLFSIELFKILFFTSSHIKPVELMEHLIIVT